MNAELLTPDDTRILARPGEVGIAHEWVVWPKSRTGDSDDTFDVRISSVELAAPGPFATLPGHDRLLIVTSGEGLILTHGDAAPRASMRRLEAYPFPAEWPTSAELAGGVVTVFNVTTRRDQAEATFETLRLGTRQVWEALDSPAALVHCIHGSLNARVSDEEDSFSLEAGECLWLQDLQGTEALEFEGRTTDCEVLLIGIRL
jgi:environmental stress-induced protein Ves